MFNGGVPFVQLKFLYPHPLDPHAPRRDHVGRRHRICREAEIQPNVTRFQSSVADTCTSQAVLDQVSKQQEQHIHQAQ